MSDTRNPSQSKKTDRNSPAGNTDDLEIATDFDDLNLEIVSEKQTDMPEPSSIDDQSCPSIDEFVIARQEHPQTEHHTADQWFVKVLGQEMGPFPFDDLVMLVVADEVGPKDHIRHTEQGEWMVAGEIAGLFPEIETDFELGGGAEFHGEQAQTTTDSPDLQVVGGELNHILSDTRPKGSAKPQQQETAQDNLAEQSDVEAESPAAQVEPQEDVEAKRKQEIANRLNAWLNDRIDEPEKEAKQEQDEQSTTAPVSSTPVNQTASEQPATYKPPAKPASAPKFKKTKQPKEKMDFSAISNLFDTRALIAVGVVALIVAGMFLPKIIGGTNDKKIYRRYEEIYAQIQRARQGNPGQLETLAKEVLPEIKNTSTALENAGAGSKKPAKQKLLFAGKFCLTPILQKKIMKPDSYDEKFEMHMKEVARLLEL